MLYHSLNYHIVITAICKQTPNMYVFLTFCVLLLLIMIVLSRYCPKYEIEGQLLHGIPFHFIAPGLAPENCLSQSERQFQTLTLKNHGVANNLLDFGKMTQWNKKQKVLPTPQWSYLALRYYQKPGRCMVSWWQAIFLTDNSSNVSHFGRSHLFTN